MEPVDTSLYTDYLKVIKYPMDLSTVQDKLFKGTYENCTSFLQDMNLIFNNAKEYNQTKSEVYKMAVTLQNTLNEQSKSCLGITPDHTHHYNTRKALEKIAGTLSSIDNDNTLTGTTPSEIKTTPTTNDDEEEEEEEGVAINNEGTSDVTSERHSDVSYTREEEEEEEHFEYLEEKEEEGNARVTRSRSKVIQEQLEIDSDQQEEEEEEEEEGRVRRSKRRRTRNKSKRNKKRKIEFEDDFDDDVPIIRTRAGRVTYKKHRYS